MEKSEALTRRGWANWWMISLRTGKSSSLNIFNRQINEVAGPFSIAMLNYQRVKPTGPWPKHWCSDGFHQQNEEGPGFETAKNWSWHNWYMMVDCVWIVYYRGLVGDYYHRWWEPLWTKQFFKGWQRGFKTAQLVFSRKHGTVILCCNSSLTPFHGPTYHALVQECGIPRHDNSDWPEPPKPIHTVAYGIHGMVNLLNGPHEIFVGSIISISSIFFVFMEMCFSYSWQFSWGT